METVKMIIRNIRAGIFYPKREGNFFCSKEFCGFHEICYKGAWMNLPPFTKVYGSNNAAEEETDE
jgi:hypothetical protein